MMNVGQFWWALQRGSSTESARCEYSSKFSVRFACQAAQCPAPWTGNVGIELVRDLFGTTTDLIKEAGDQSNKSALDPSSFSRDFSCPPL